MEIKEYLKLSPIQRDIIFCWRILYYPQSLTAKQMSKLTGHSEILIKDTMALFNKNMRLKLESDQFTRRIKQCIAELMCEDIDLRMFIKNNRDGKD